MFDHLQHLFRCDKGERVAQASGKRVGLGVVHAHPAARHYVVAQQHRSIDDSDEADILDTC